MGKLKRKGFMLERKIFEISFNSPMGKLKQRIEGGVKIIGYVCFNSPMGKLKPVLYLYFLYINYLKK